LTLTLTLPCSRCVDVLCVCVKVMAKAEAVELVRRGVGRLKERAQLMVDDIEVDKTQLDGDGARDDVQWALTTIDVGELDQLQP